MDKLFLALISLYTANAFLTNSPRDVVKVLTVHNGGQWGDWTGPYFCAKGAYAVGYSMKIESYQYGRDDTTLNAIALHCEFPSTGTFGGDITSGQGSWGSWDQKTMCRSTSDFSSMFLKGFSLQVESRQEDGDDTAANFVKFKCNDMQNDYPSQELGTYPGHGLFGSFGGWSDTCDPGSAICGLNTRIEGCTENRDVDDTSLNDVIFYCCSD